MKEREKMLNRKDVENVILSLLKREDINDSDRVLILSLGYKIDYSFPDEFLKKCSNNLQIKALLTSGVKLMESKYELLKDNFEELTFNEFWILLSSLVFDNSIDIQLLKRLTQYFFNRYSQYMFTENGKKILPELNNPVYLNKYYNMLCYLSLFYFSTDDEVLEKAWKKVLEYSENIKIPSDELTFDWIQLIENNTTSDFSESVYRIIFWNITGSPLNKFSCKNKLLANYINIILVFIFSKLDDKKIYEFLKTHNVSATEKLLSDSDSLFLKWIKNSNTELYPNSNDICLKNIAYNGLIVLKKKNEFFVKSLRESSEIFDFDYLSYKERKDKDFECVIDIIKYEVLVNYFSNSQSLMELLCKIAKLKAQSDDFKTRYNVKYPVYYNPTFIDKDSLFPLTPFYSIYNNIITEDSIYLENDESSFYNNILKIIPDTNDVKMISNENNPFNFDYEHLEKRFFPQSRLIVRNENEKLEFISNFVKFCNSNCLDNIFNYEYYWCLNILNNIKKDKGLTNSVDTRPSLTFFTIYHDHYANCIENVHADLFKILLAVDERIIVKGQTLLSFFNAIRDSLSKFLSYVDINISNFHLIELINTEEEIVMSAVNIENEDKDKLSGYINQKIELTYNLIEDQNNVSVYLNGSKISKECSFSILDFENKTHIEQVEDLTEYESELKNRTVFSKLDKNKDSENLVLIIIPRELSKTFDTIVKRQEYFNHFVANEPNNIKLELFRKNSFKKEALNVLNHFQYKPRLINKLENHYLKPENIEDRLSDWLSLFNIDSIKNSKFEVFINENRISFSTLYNALLTLIELHHIITVEDRDWFINNIKAINDTKNLIFPLKDPPSDCNGLNRLFFESRIQRDIDFSIIIKDLYTQDKNYNAVYLISDIFLSGTQSEKALKYYFDDFKKNEEIDYRNKSLVNERYYKFANLHESEKFKYNMLKIKEVIFLAPIRTKEFQVKINDVTNSFFPNAKVQFSSNRIIENETWKYSGVKFDNNHQSIFEKLIKDCNLIQKIFEIDEFYDNSIEDIDNTNLILRRSSLPKKHFKLFSLKPRNGFEPLLDFQKEWGKKS